MRELFLGNNMDVLRTLEANSIDSIVTDPPYGLSFMGKKWDYEVPSVELWREVLRVLKPGGHVLSFGGTRTYHRMVVNIEDAGFEIRDQIQWIYGSGFPKSHNLEGANEGWGTALKPANEPIVLARKPLNGTVASNVAEYGTGALNIDASRISTNGEKLSSHGNKGDSFSQSYKSRWQEWLSQNSDVEAMLDALAKDENSNIEDFYKTQNHYKQIAGCKPEAQPGHEGHAQGRWPANVLFDEEAAAALDGQAEATSRFFYVAKASKRERGEGNVHPTVKPTKLMEYLVRMITPPGGICLDPFMGSGTTGVACKTLDVAFIGIELEQAYFEIANKRTA